MKLLNCLIIEDEPLAAEITQSYIEQVSFLKLEQICSDAIAAFEVLKEKQIDVIFLDIHLPKLKGIDFLKTLSTHPKVIITSAYKQYALEGFELEITDYLLKPFSFPRFLKAVNRLQTGAESIVPPIAASAERAHRFFNVNKKRFKIYLDDIIFVESLKDYVKIVTKDKSIVTKSQLGELEEVLNDKNFVRIHRSFLVAKNKIDAVSSTEVEAGGKSIPIGRSYQDSIKKELEGFD